MNLTWVLAAVLLALLAAAGVSVALISGRERGGGVGAADRAQLAAELVALEDELQYAEAFAIGDDAAAAGLARAHRELNAAFATYNQASAVDGAGLSTGDANSIRARLALVRQTMADPASFAGSSPSGQLPAIIVNTQLAPTVGNGSTVFQAALWVLGLVPGLVFAVKKRQARNYFAALDQRINVNAAQIDAFLAQREQILQSSGLALAGALEPQELGEPRNAVNGRIDRAYQVLIERSQQQHGGPSPDLAAALRADRNVQREVTAARTLYNDTVNMWNTDIFSWPTKLIVAAESGLKARPVFVASQLAAATQLTGLQ